MEIHGKEKHIWTGYILTILSILLMNLITSQNSLKETPKGSLVEGILLQMTFQQKSSLVKYYCRNRNPQRSELNLPTLKFGVSTSNSPSPPQPFLMQIWFPVFRGIFGKPRNSLLKSARLQWQVAMKVWISRSTRHQLQDWTVSIDYQE